MKIFSWEEIKNQSPEVENYFFNKESGISTGSFDGLHKGHKILLNQLIENCKKRNILSGLVSFTRPLPFYKHSKEYAGDISSLKQRIELLRNTKVDFLILIEFNKDFASQTGEEYFNLLKKACNLSFIAEGVDFHCGYKGSTGKEEIKFYGKRNNVETLFLEPVISDSQFQKSDSEKTLRLSSSYIRKLIKEADFLTVSDLLQRPFSLDISSCQIIKENYLDFTNKISLQNFAQVLPPDSLYCVRIKNGEIEFGQKDSVSKVLIKNGFLYF